MTPIQCRHVRLDQYVNCKPLPLAYIRGPTCIQGPASTTTTTSDPQPVFEAWLVFEEIR